MQIPYWLGRMLDRVAEWLDDHNRNLIKSKAPSFGSSPLFRVEFTVSSYAKPLDIRIKVGRDLNRRWYYLIWSIAGFHIGRGDETVVRSFNGDWWKSLKTRYGGYCLCCNRHESTLLKTSPNGHIVGLTKDHIVPLSMGGSNSPWNIQPLCRSCNTKKGRRTIDYRKGWKPPQK